MRGSRNASKKNQAPQPIAGVIESLMGSLGLLKRYHGWLVVNRWPEIVGEHLARRTEAIRFEDGILYVAVPDPSWRQELAMQTENILREIRNLPYGRAVKQLRLVHGRKGT